MLAVVKVLVLYVACVVAAVSNAVVPVSVDVHKAVLVNPVHEVSVVRTVESQSVLVAAATHVVRNVNVAVAVG